MEVLLGGEGESGRVVKGIRDGKVDVRKLELTQSRASEWKLAGGEIAEGLTVEISKRVDGQPIAHVKSREGFVVAPLPRMTSFK